MRPSFQFCCMWIFPWIKVSWRSCSVWDKFRWLNWFWQFLCKGLSLIWEDSITHVHGLAVYVKEGLHFAWTLSLESSANSYLYFWLASLHSVSYFFFLCPSPSSLLCMVFNSISSNIDEVFSINTAPNVFVFGDFNMHHEDWLTYSGGTDRPGEICYNFPIRNDLTQMVSFPTWIPDCDSHSPTLLYLFLFFVC